VTLLVGGSLLLVCASAVALLVGWVTAATELIWASILASVGAGVLLALAYVRSRAEAAVLAAGRVGNLREAPGPHAPGTADPEA